MTHPGGGAGSGPGGPSGPGRLEPPDWWPHSRERWINALLDIANAPQHPEIAPLLNRRPHS